MSLSQFSLTGAKILSTSPTWLYIHITGSPPRNLRDRYQENLRSKYTAFFRDWRYACEYDWNIRRPCSECNAYTGHHDQERVGEQARVRFSLAIQYAGNAVKVLGQTVKKERYPANERPIGTVFNCIEFGSSHAHDNNLISSFLLWFATGSSAGCPRLYASHMIYSSPFRWRNNKYYRFWYATYQHGLAPLGREYGTLTLSKGRGYQLVRMHALW